MDFWTLVLAIFVSQWLFAISVAVINLIVEG